MRIVDKHVGIVAIRSMCVSCWEWANHYSLPDMLVLNSMRCVSTLEGERVTRRRRALVLLQQVSKVPAASTRCETHTDVHTAERQQ